MEIELILVPYDSAQRGVRMGAGPEALVAAGLPAALERAGHRVSQSVVEPAAGSWRAEVRTAFELAAGVAERVRGAREAGRFPLVLSGNCFAAVGVVAGLGASAVVWCDAHADFNTPETTTTGFLDGMGLAVLTGRCWTGMVGQVPGFAPVRDARTWLAGARDLDPGEAAALERSAIRRVPAAALGADLAADVRGALAPADRLYLHLDLDVLDAAEGRANSYAAPHGATAAALAALCSALGARAGAATLSSYEPACDAEGRVRHAAIAAATALLAGAGA